MKIKVEQVLSEGGDTRVKFSSDYGYSSAIWASGAPTCGAQYDIEFEIDDDLVWGESISKATKDSETISFRQDNVVIIGTVLKFEADGCLSIRLGDNVILLDVEEMPDNISGLVECRASKVKLYSTNL